MRLRDHIKKSNRRTYFSRKRKICSTIRFFDMITQSLNLNVRFLIMLFFGHSKFLLLCTKPPSAYRSRPNGTGKFSEFFLRVRGDPNDEIDHKRKICSTIRFFDMISSKFEFEENFKKFPPFCYL